MEHGTIVRAFAYLVVSLAGTNGCSSQVSGRPSDNGVDDPVSPGDATVESVRINDIQGRTHRSPLEGESVGGVIGVVTALTASGFYIQSTDEGVDDDVATSEGVFVFTRNPPSVSEGDLVAVSGRVAEYRSGCSECDAASAADANLSTTELQEPAIEVIRSGAALPSAIRLGAEGRRASAAVAAGLVRGDIEGRAAILEPDRDAIDFYESLEGMLVQVNDPIAVGPTNVYGEVVVLPDGGLGAEPRSVRGGLLQGENETHPERLLIEDAMMPFLDVGDGFSGVVRAVVGYDYGSYRLTAVGGLPTVVSGGLARESTTFGAPRQGELTVATYNVENLDPGDGAARFAEVAATVASDLDSPDLLALIEIQDDSGADDDGTVSAESTLSLLEQAIYEASGVRYAHASVDPNDGADGGEPGGNIRVALLFRSDRGLALVERTGADASTPNEVVMRSGAVALRFSPGLVEPRHVAFVGSRKPLAAEFRFGGDALFVIATHFVSKVGDEPLFGRFQPPATPSAAIRLEQASVVAGFVSRLLSVDGRARIIVLGDMNDAEYSPSLGMLADAGLASLTLMLPPDERYGYVYEGVSLALDHILVSPALAECIAGVDVVHVGAEFAVRVSDHDPMSARFALGGQPVVAGR